MARTEALRRLAELVGSLVVNPHLPPRWLRFDARWNMAEQEMTPEGQVKFFRSELIRLRRRIIEGGIKHRTVDQDKTTSYLDLKREDIEVSALPGNVKKILVPSEAQEIVASMALETGRKIDAITLRVGSVPAPLFVGDWLDLTARNHFDADRETGEISSWAQGPLGHRLEGFIARVGDLGVGRELVRLTDFVIDRRLAGA